MYSWILMLLSDLIIPFTMLILGLLLKKRPPKNMNSLLGYRTARSMKNKDTLEFAQKHFGKIWYICGGVMIPVTVIAMLFVLGKNDDAIGTLGIIICIIQLVVMIGSIVPTERALKNNFDLYGFRKK